jgi:hypothetical protein
MKNYLRFGLTLALMSFVLSPILVHSSLVQTKPVATDLPPSIICTGSTYGTYGASAGLGGYDPDGKVVLVTVMWGDGMVDSSSQWNYCTLDGTNYYIPPQLGHLFTHFYQTAGTYQITISLIDNSGSGTGTSWSVAISTPPPPPPSSNNGVGGHPALHA